MMRRFRLPTVAAVRLAVVAGYGLLSCALTWPLPRHFRTHLLGDPTGDTGLYVWNVWIFGHELLRHARLPVSTDHIFGYSGGADFSLHNYAPLAGALGVPLVGPLGIVGAFNVMLLGFMALSGVAMFVLARRLGLGRLGAWAAGALFMASPVLTAKATAHFSLVIAAALPLFLWALLRTLDSGKLKDGVLVGAAVALAFYSDAYYAVYCVMMGAVVVGWRYLSVARSETARVNPVLIRTISLTIAALVCLIAWRIISGTTGFSVGPVQIRIRTLYTPLLILVALTIARLWLTRRIVLRLDPAGNNLAAVCRSGIAAAASCLILLTPPLAGLAIRVYEGRIPDTEVYWRSSPRGVDLLSYLVPNPNHPWFGDVTRSWFMPARADAFPEFVASFSIVAFGAIAAAAYLRLVPRLWLGFTAFFVALSLGPFVHVAGMNTSVVGPWAFLRYVPVIGMARAPSRFAIVAALGLALLSAFAVDALWKRYRWSRWVLVLLVAIGIEVIPAPRQLFSAAIPDVYRHVATTGDEDGALLELPTGIRDGTFSAGDFNASSAYFQTAHRRRLVGGYLSRISSWRKREKDRAPMLRALFALSQGDPLSAELKEAAQRSREAFLRRACVKFILVDKGRATADLQSFAVDALQLTALYEDDGYALYAPVDAPACDPPAGRRRSPNSRRSGP